jgi:hypothetical protein
VKLTSHVAVTVAFFLVVDWTLLIARILLSRRLLRRRRLWGAVTTWRWRLAVAKQVVSIEHLQKSNAADKGVSLYPVARRIGGDFQVTGGGIEELVIGRTIYFEVFETSVESEKWLRQLSPSSAGWTLVD